MKNTSQYKHFCDAGICQFLGCYKHSTIHGDIEYDLYYCSVNKSIHARFGSEPGDEICDFVSASIKHPALWQARRQVKIQGLVK